MHFSIDLFLLIIRMDYNYLNVSYFHIRNIFLTAERGLSLSQSSQIILLILPKTLCVDR